MTTKDQERQAIEKIRKIVEGLGENSYVGFAMEGVLELAKDNIREDTACSMKKRAEIAWERADKAEKENKDLKKEVEDLKKTVEKRGATISELNTELCNARAEAKANEVPEELIPGQFTIEQATGQQRPPENDIPVQPELQIERFFEALNKGERERVLKCDTRMAAYLISIRYRDVRIRNGHFNYQASKEGITFNPDSTMQYSLTWNELSEELAKRFGKKQKPVRIVSVDAPEKPQSTLTEAEAVKALFEAYPNKLKTIMRICRQCKNNGEAAKAVQKEIAPYGWHAVSGSEVEYTFMGFTAGLEITVKKEKVTMKYGRLIVEAKNLYDPYSPEFDAEEERCQKASDQEENAAKKQQDEKSNTWGMIPSTWEEVLKDIQIPTSTEITGYLYDEERKLKEILEAEEKEPGFPWMAIYRQQLIVGGLRIIKKIIESQED